VESARIRLLAINDVSKIDIFGAQDEKKSTLSSRHRSSPAFASIARH
jgi:hypothetical protein